MRHSAAIGVWLAVLALVACESGTAPPAQNSHEAPPRNEPEPKRAELVIEVDGLRNDRGRVLCSLYRSAEGFPSDAEAAERKGRIELPAEEAVRFRFEGLEPGPWAAAVVHDENGDGRLNRGVLNIPTEGYGVSNNPAKGFGAPGFKDARMELAPGERTVSITVKYH